MQVAVFPLTVPCLPNPAGIVVLATAPAKAGPIAVLAVAVGALVVVLAPDVAVFCRAVQVGSKLDASRIPANRRRCPVSCPPPSQRNRRSTDCPTPA